MYWIDHQGDDPALNLALEEVLLGRMEPGHPGFVMLWQNRPTIVVGRFQNARGEINAAYVREHGIAVVRRMTGGGAVYHDSGTLNYTFVRPLDRAGRSPAFSEAAAPVAGALRALGLPVTFSGRNDMMLNGRKVGGLAQCRRGGGFLHHGCILVNTDLDALAGALDVDPEKFRSKGVASVRARVGNLAEARPLEVADVRAALLERRDGPLYTPTLADMAEARRLRDEKYASPDWTYGVSPAFTERKARRFSWGLVEALFEVRGGRVAGCRIHGDFFMDDFSMPGHETGGRLEDLETALIGLAYTPEAMRPVLAGFPLAAMFSGCAAEELTAFLLPDLPEQAGS